MALNSLKTLIREVPDFPKKGVSFKDITPLLKDPKGFRTAIDSLTSAFNGKGIDVVVSAEARGFIIGPAVAYKLCAGFVPIRKPGKLPYKTKSVSYELEYGTDTLQVHEDAVVPGQRLLMVDDVLATGGTMAACCRLVESLGGKVVACAFVIELTFLDGKKALEKYPVFSLIQY